MQTTFQSIAALVPNLLGDLDKALWTEATSKVFINSALREFHQHLRDHGVRQLLYKKDFASLPAGTTTIGVGTGGANDLPADFIEPVAMWEAPTTSTGLKEFVAMVGPAQLPNRAQTATLGNWDWTGGAIQLVGATEARRVMLDYYGSLNDLNVLSDVVQTPDATEPIAYLACAKIADAQDNERLAMRFRKEAMDGIFRIKNEDIKATQSVPVRRRPRLGFYRYPSYR